MHRGWGRGRTLVCAAALLVSGACTGALHRASQAPASDPGCSLAEPPSVSGDSATIILAAGDTTHQRCSLTLVARALRPWPNGSDGPWTVLLLIADRVVTARRLEGEQARDAIDAGLPVLLTDDLDLASYASVRADLEVTSLPWDMTYVSLHRDAAIPLGAAVGPDAVRADAREASPLACDSLPTGDARTPPHTRMERILYIRGDGTARELAERLVALTARRDVTAVAVSAQELDVALLGGNAVAYVVAMPRAAQCDSLAILAQRAPWIASSVIHPLIDVRAHLIRPRAARP